MFSYFKSTLAQIFDRRKIVASLIYIVIPALVIYSVSVVILANSGFTIVEILRDPAQQTGLSSFLGFVSNIGVWLWVAAATVCFFSLSANRFKRGNGSMELLILMGLLSLLLAIDDLFLLHDRHVHQKGIFIFYAICAVTILVRHFSTVMKVDGFSFVMSGLLLMTSIYIDLHQKKINMDYADHQLIEEACKFVGAALWMYFCGRSATYYWRQNLTSDQTGLPDE